MSDLLDVSVALPGGVTISCDPPFVLVSSGEGDREWRKMTVEGRYQHGRAVVAQVLETVELVLVVRIEQPTWIEAQNRYGELVTAVSGFTYPVTVTRGGHALTYQCEAANIRRVNGDSVDKFRAALGAQEYRLALPYDPSTVA